MDNTKQTDQPVQAEVKEKKQNPWKRIIILAVILALILLLTNPSLMFFLPAAWRESLKEFYHGLFGDVDQISKVIQIKWISLFKLAVIILFMMILKAVLKLVLEIKSKKKPRPRTAGGAFSFVRIRSLRSGRKA